jgi:hypothetical protein
MELKDCILPNAVIVSPLEARHYLLDLPPVKESLRLGAVTYALRPLYPGNAETSAIDYRYSRQKTLGVAILRRRLESYRNYGLPVVSAALVIAQFQQRGIAVCLSREWLEIQRIEDGVSMWLQCFAFDVERISAEINSFLDNPDCSDLPVSVYSLPDADTALIDSIDRLKGTQAIPIERILSARIIASCELFPPEGTKARNGAIRAVAAVILALACLSAGDIALASIARKETAKMLEAKSLYETRKAALLESRKASARSGESKTDVQEGIPFYSILSEVHEVDDRLWCNSFEFSGGTFRFEAEGATALTVVAALQRSPFFSGITLQQASPSAFSGEKFVVSGQVRND